jgi:hypothetical protein
MTKLFTNKYVTDGIPGVQHTAGRNFSLRHNIQTGSGAHPVSYPVDTGFLASRIRLPVREASHSHTVARLKIHGAYLYSPIRLCIVCYIKD